MSFTTAMESNRRIGIDEKLDSPFDTTPLILVDTDAWEGYRSHRNRRI